jgi:ribosomal protein S18 acetylase RimI-like enzyme
LTRDAALVEQLIRDFRQARLDAADRAMLEYAVKLTQEPWNMVERDVEVLREAGFSDEAILDINQVTGYYAFVNRLADGLGVELEGIWDQEESSLKGQDVVIGAAEMSDAAEILTLQKTAFQSEAALWDDYTIPPLTQTLEELKEDFQRQVYLKAVLDGQLIGSVRGYAQDGTCYVGRLIVHPDHQNRGIGARLMHAIEGLFGGVSRYEIFTGEKSQRNIHLYQRLGYRIFQTRRLTDKVTLVYMEKKGREQDLTTATVR